MKNFIILLFISFTSKVLFGQSNCTDLMIAIKNNNLSAVRSLIKRTDIDCIDKNNDPRTPLLLAARSGYGEIATCS